MHLGELMTKILVSAIVVCLLSTSSTAQIASNSIPADYFPLAIGNTWTYSYNADRYSLDDIWHIDTGIVEYRIAAASQIADTIHWAFVEIRHLTHIDYDFFYPKYTTWYFINDSSTIEMLESTSGNHRILRNVDNRSLMGADPPSLWNAVFPFARDAPDSGQVMRYAEPGLTDSSVIRGEFPTYSYTIVVLRGIGVVQTFCSKGRGGPTGEIHNSHHFLKQSTLTSVHDQFYDSAEDVMTLAVHPNPFNSLATVTLNNSREGKVSVRIVDILGRRVADLFEGTLAAGIHQFTWDASGHSSGVYFCSVFTAWQTYVAKLVLTK